MRNKFLMLVPAMLVSLPAVIADLGDGDGCGMWSGSAWTGGMMGGGAFGWFVMAFLWLLFIALAAFVFAVIFWGVKRWVLQNNKEHTRHKKK